jgi:hypothetical protein
VQVSGKRYLLEFWRFRKQDVAGNRPVTRFLRLSIYQEGLWQPAFELGVSVVEAMQSPIYNHAWQSVKLLN